MRFIFKSIENYNTLIKKNKLKSNQIQIYSTKKPYFTQFCFSSKSSNLLRGYFDCFSKTKMLIKRTIFCRLSGVDSLETPLSPSWLCFFAHRLIISLYFFFSPFGWWFNWPRKINMTKIIFGYQIRINSKATLASKISQLYEENVHYLKHSRGCWRWLQ